MRNIAKNSDQTVIFCNLPQVKDGEFHLKTWGRGKNINSKIEAMEGVFSNIPDRFMDFLDIATSKSARCNSPCRWISTR